MAAIVEPVKRYERTRTKGYTQQTPLNRMIDAVSPESDTARKFLGAVDEALAGKRDRKELRPALLMWRDIQLPQSFLLEELAPVTANISALAKAGLEALDYLDQRKTAPAGWTIRQHSLLDAAKQSHAELLISIVPPIERLVRAAAGE